MDEAGASGYHLHMMVRASAVFLVIAGVPTLAGCITNQFATPRTLPPGQTSYTMAAEGTLNFDFSGEPGDLHGRFQMRHGLAERVDLGVMFGPYLGMDVKLNFLRTKFVDMAFTPGIFYSAFPMPFQSTRHVVQFNGPISVGFNVDKSVTIYLHGVVSGNVIMYGYDEHCQPPDCDGKERNITPYGGLGAQFRVSPVIAITPEISLFAPIQEQTEVYINGGIGVSFGAQPNYDD